MRHRTCLARTTFYTVPDRAFRRPWTTFGRIWKTWMILEEASRVWGACFEQSGVLNYASATLTMSDGSVVPVSREELYVANNSNTDLTLELRQ